MNETYYGQSFINQIARFIYQLEVIEEEYWWWFRSRHGQSNEQDFDMLTNHVELDFFDFDHLSFKFMEDSDLPNAIRSRCIGAYVNVFNV